MDCHQVETVFNHMLDRTADLRDQLGLAADAVSLQAALDGLWQRAAQRFQRQDPPGQQHQQEVGMAMQPGPPLLPHPSPQQHQQQQVQAAGLAHTADCKQLPQQQQHSATASQTPANEARHLLMQWHMANIEFANATRLRCLSMKHWDLDDAHEHQGAHVFLPGGNLRLLEGLAQGIPIMYDTPARLLQYCTSGVRQQLATEATTGWGWRCLGCNRAKHVL
jgi:hypothetical protein